QRIDPFQKAEQRECGVELALARELSQCELVTAHPKFEVMQNLRMEFGVGQSRERFRERRRERRRQPRQHLFDQLETATALGCFGRYHRAYCLVRNDCVDEIVAHRLELALRSLQRLDQLHDQTERSFGGVFGERIDVASERRPERLESRTERNASKRA